MCVFFTQLDVFDKTEVKFIITTCLDPWSTLMEFMDNLANIMRNAIMTAIDTVTYCPRENIFFDLILSCTWLRNTRAGLPTTLL